MSEDITTRSVLTDTIIALANSFKENGFNPPVRIEVDQLTFDKLLTESLELYNIDSKKAIKEREFSLSGITIIKEEEGPVSREEKLTEEQEQQQEQQQYQQLTTTITKYKCPDCGAIFDTRLAHRKHHQAFHDNIKEPEEIKQPAI
jgi:isopenicillin N synthase-like dioxygenase